MTRRSRGWGCAGTPAPPHARIRPSLFRASGRPRGRVLALVSLALLVFVGGCGRSGESSFPGSSSSLDALGEEVLESLVAGDTLALGRVRLTRSEHDEVVWPELPAARPEIGFPVELAWQNIERRNRHVLTRILPWFRNRELRFEGVECRAGVQEFETFRVHTGCRVLLRSAEDGPLEASLFEDVLERNGGFKIFRYYDRLPRPREASASVGYGGRSPRRVCGLRSNSTTFPS